MASAKEHYQNHLSPVYSWMCGDFDERKKEFIAFVRQQGLLPRINGAALDLGAGHGIQSLALAECGYKVTAVDFDAQLLRELEKNAEGFDVTTVQDDIRNLSHWQHLRPELAVCCGDTLAHLESKKEVEAFIQGVSSILSAEGKLLLTFRDYSVPLKGEERFIHVRGDDKRILTCFLEYFDEYIEVTDLLYQRSGNGWGQSQSTYRKVRLLPKEVIHFIEGNGMGVAYRGNFGRMVAVVAEKKG